MEPLLDIIKQEPIEDPEHKNICPFCAADTVQEMGRCSTLLGIPEANHVWVDSRCKWCGGQYTQQYKYDWVWYQAVDDPLVLKGVHACFESAEYNCKECDGRVKRTYTELDGETPTKCLSTQYQIDGPPIKRYREFWACEKCGIQVEKL